MRMKPRDEWPIDGKRPEETMKPGMFLVVLDHKAKFGNEVTAFRIHRRIVVEGGNAWNIGSMTYEDVDPKTLKKPVDKDKYYTHEIHEGTSEYEKLAPVMNLIGTCQAPGFCPAFVVTEEELRAILGLEESDGGQS